MEKYMLILTDTFEEIEAVTQVDFLRRAGIVVDMISITGKIQVTSNRGITVIADDVIENIIPDEYFGIIIPGGLPAAFNIRDDERVLKILKDFNKQNKLIAGICAGPCVLAKAGVLKGRDAVIYPKMESELLDANVKYDAVCVDENIITARGAGLALEFAYTLVRKIKGKVQEKQLRVASVDNLLREWILKEENK
ncbi:MAG: DJ-1 family glyoxalase III [Parvimonas sp.]|uniref:DJ-1 family glyoxalase III n=1 Tax=Parvimonas sp. TaxID=1944660 RepID=UPI0025CD3A93|nr:DJ-1 family glyoxalase III [Parvimonas sp.]MCI5998002.1 DJ-1/PfpI family protein [Parvimonas sp.]MDY3051378.1 DJ-1 family glyoxalase III [Parvimonas sp.]